MKLNSHIPIVHNGVFIYDLDVEDNLIDFFSKEKFYSLKDVKDGDRNLPQLSVDKNILSKFTNLKKEIDDAFVHLLNEVIGIQENEVHIYNSWITKTYKNHESSAHRHPNAWLSGVFYPEENNCFQIRFFNDFLSSFNGKINTHSLYNAHELDIIPKKNQLFIFFSNLRHMIVENKTDKIRYSLAFNCLPKGEFGINESAYNFK
jgi:uncharacterized protein (TIGR02466 family)|tara:strand:+ start:386 stop:997 length:612 start_codon:yes stop_codon:yes gene_type:complete